jgi:hypothetical protein
MVYPRKNGVGRVGRGFLGVILLYPCKNGSISAVNRSTGWAISAVNRSIWAAASLY